MKKKMSEKNGLLEAVFILDRSGSMRGKEEGTIDDSSFEELKEDYRKRGVRRRRNACLERKVCLEAQCNTADDYGFTLETPIEVRGIDTEYFYLNNLVFKDGSQVFYKRKGSCLGSRERPIDKFFIYDSEDDVSSGSEPVAELYIYGYGKECSITAPKGFKFKSDDYVKAVTRPDLFIPEL